jgi:hypothetical protein
LSLFLPRFSSSFLFFLSSLTVSFLSHFLLLFPFPSLHYRCYLDVPLFLQYRTKRAEATSPVLMLLVLPGRSSTEASTRQRPLL